MQIKTKEIGDFLQSLSPADYSFLGHCMNFRDSVSSLIKRHNLDKKQVCEIFEIKEKDYDKFTLGNFNYSLMDMARLNAAFMRLESEKLAKAAPFQVAEPSKEKS